MKRETIVGLIAIVAIVAVVMFAGCISRGPDKEIVNAVSQACSGKGVEQAAAYTGGPGSHPIVLIRARDGGYHGWNRRLPEDWWPESVSTTELVACLENEEEKRIQTCKYIGGSSIRRYQYELTIRLVAAQTGETIETHTLRGGSPPQCLQTERRRIGRLSGSHVQFEAVQNWLSKFTNP